jgi:Protein of unknown function (DUF2909)
MDEIKLVVLVLLGAVIVSLGKAMFHMSSGAGDSARMAKALTVRVVLSLLLFAVLFAGWYLGLISPRGSH